MYDRDTIQALRNATIIALKAFVDEANRTRAKFNDFENLSAVSEEYLQEILNQRIIENEAFERYQRTRRALFEMARQSNGQKSSPAWVMNGSSTIPPAPPKF